MKENEAVLNFLLFVFGSAFILVFIGGFAYFFIKIWVENPEREFRKEKVVDEEKRRETIGFVVLVIFIIFLGYEVWDRHRWMEENIQYNINPETGKLEKTYPSYPYSFDD